MNIKSIIVPSQQANQTIKQEAFTPLERFFLGVRSAARCVGDEAKQVGLALEKETKVARNRIGAGWKSQKQMRCSVEEESRLHQQLQQSIEQAEHDNEKEVIRLQTICSVSQKRARELLEAASGCLERAVDIHFSPSQQLLAQPHLQQLPQQQATSANDVFDDESDLSAEENAAQAREQGLLIIRNHLNWFLQKNPNASYVAWIAALHPENAKMTDTELHKRGNVSLDSRFLIPGNPWITVYEAALTTKNRNALLAQ